jgi:DeoR family glycerol-3-phosphate regulon repressor
MKAASREPQSRNMASLVSGAVVKGPGVRRNGSVRAMADPFSGSSCRALALSVTFGHNSTYIDSPIALILEVLAKKGSVSVGELHRRLKVSRETIRRDITRLASEDRLKKTHGGALSRGAVEAAFDERQAVNVDGKRAIGRLAATLVPDGASVIIDAGATTAHLAEALAGRRRLIIYTNDLRAALRLAGHNDNRVHVLGGELVDGEGATMGRDATVMMGNYFADFAFVGVGALSSKPALMDYGREAAVLRGMMLGQARTPVLLADHLDLVTHVVVDRRPEGKLAAALKTLGADLLVGDV